MKNVSKNRTFQFVTLIFCLNSFLLHGVGPNNENTQNTSSQPCDQDIYSVLGVPRDIPQEQLDKGALKKLVYKFHPDKHSRILIEEVEERAGNLGIEIETLKKESSDNDEQYKYKILNKIFAALNEAKETITNPELRACYDYFRFGSEPDTSNDEIKPFAKLFESGFYQFLEIQKQKNQTFEQNIRKMVEEFKNVLAALKNQETLPEDLKEKGLIVPFLMKTLGEHAYHHRLGTDKTKQENLLQDFFNSDEYNKHQSIIAHNTFNLAHRASQQAAFKSSGELEMNAFIEFLDVKEKEAKESDPQNQSADNTENKEKETPAWKRGGKILAPFALGGSIGGLFWLLSNRYQARKLADLEARILQLRSNTTLPSQTRSQLHNKYITEMQSIEDNAETIKIVGGSVGFLSCILLMLLLH